MTEKKTIAQRAKDCLKDALDRESENIRRAEEAIRFRALEQWPDQVKRDRENPYQKGGSRPCPVMDKTNQYVRQVINEERQNRAAIKIRPVDDNADKKVADVYTGIIRHIEDASDALVAYTTAGEHAVDGGFGYWRLLTEYCDPESFDQDIRIKRVPNRFSVALGPHNEPDGSDAQEAVIWEDMQEEDFEREYPKAKKGSFDGDYPGWRTDKTIRVAEYICIKKDTRKIHLMEDGSVIDDERLKAINDALKDQTQMEIKPIKSRNSVQKTVRWYKVTADEVLDERELLGTYIPVVKVVGNELFMPDGKCRTSGMVESAMDPQRLHNYAAAGFIENVALAPRAPWIGPKGFMAGSEETWAVANRQNVVGLEYTPVPDPNGQMLPPPQRVQPAGIAPGWENLLFSTEHSIEASVGMYGPTVGAKSQEKSGVALQEQKAQGMVGNLHFPDNLARSIRHTGRILLEWIPLVYDTERVARMLGEDGIPDMAYLNPAQELAVMPRRDQLGREIGTSYNLNVGRYDVTVSTGPSWTSKRQEGAAMMSEVTANNPGLMQIIGDLYFRALDVPYADKIADRLKLMLPPQIQQMEDNKDKGQQDPRVQAAMMQIDQASKALEAKGQAIQQAQTEVEQAAVKVGQDRMSVESTKKDIEAEKQSVAAAKQVLSAEVKNSMAQIELAGRKIIDEIEAVIEPLVQKLNEPQTEPEKPQGPQTIIVQDPALQEILKGVMELTANATQQMTETVSQAMNGVAEAVSRPRRSTLVRDAQGNAVGSVSE